MHTRRLPPTSTSRPARRALLIAPAALLLAACGSGSASAPAAAPTSDPAVTSPASTPPPASSQAAPPPATSAAPTGTGQATEAGPPRCPTTALAGSVRAGDAGAGQRSATLVLTNRSGRTCRLDGYGGVQLADGAGRAVPTQQVRDAGTPPRSVTLAPGAAGSSVLRWTAVPGAGPCPSAPASLRVIPPDQRSALSVPWSLGPVCGGGRISQGAYRRG